MAIDNIIRKYSNGESTFMHILFYELPRFDETCGYCDQHCANLRREECFESYLLHLGYTGRKKQDEYVPNEKPVIERKKKKKK